MYLTTYLDLDTWRGRWENSVGKCQLQLLRLHLVLCLVINEMFLFFWLIILICIFSEALANQLYNQVCGTSVMFWLILYNKFTEKWAENEFSVFSFLIIFLYC